MSLPTSTSSQASEALPLQPSGTDTARSPSVTTNPTPKLSSKSIGRTCRATKTSAKYEASYTQESLFSREDFRANLSPSQASNEARMITATSGQKCCALYGKQSRLGSLVRMLLASSTWHSTRCVLTWKQKATKSNRLLFQLAPSTRRTEETGFGLWPTPTVDNSANVNPKENRFRCLVRAVNESVMWPTPSTRDGKGGYIGGRIRNGKVSMDTLDVAVQHTDNQEKQRGSLNPTWVAWLMGYPTEWLNYVDSATPSSRKSRQKSSDASTK